MTMPPMPEVEESLVPPAPSEAPRRSDFGEAARCLGPMCAQLEALWPSDNY